MASDCPKSNLGNLNCDSEGLIDETDLNLLLGWWSPNGPVPSPLPGQVKADLNNDQKVDEEDLTILLTNWIAVKISPPAGGPPVDGVSQGDYPRPPARNYVFYDWQNEDYNQKYPEGAPWGSVAVFPWEKIHFGLGQFNWQPIDDYLTQAQKLGKAVLLEILPYESDMPGKTPIASQYQCSDSNQKIYPMYWDMTPNWVREKTGSFFIPLDGQGGRSFCRPLRRDRTPEPQWCYAVAVMPKYNHPLYQEALKDLIFGLGKKYSQDSRVAGVIFGQGIDAEFGEFTKGQWGDCRIKDSAEKLGFSAGRDYLPFFVKEGRDNDYTDWYAQAFPNKPVYHQVTSGGKDKVAVMMAQGYANLGIKQAGILPDHSWFSDSGGTGLLDIVRPWIGKRPIAWENPYGALAPSPERTRRQFVYGMMLPALSTFPDFFDFVGGMCLESGESDGLAVCNWAKQYYGRTPQTTRDIWIAFQQSQFPTSGGNSAKSYYGWVGEWEYGLQLVSQKGETLGRQELLKLFNQAVADGYSGQARKVKVGETLVLAPLAGWRGLAASRYELLLTLVDNQGKVKVEAGSEGEWETVEFERGNQKNWQVKSLSVNKKVSQVKITPLTGDPLYLHMVKLAMK